MRRGPCHARQQGRGPRGPAPRAVQSLPRQTPMTQAARQPCVVITAADSVTDPALQMLAEQVEHRLQCAVLVVGPEAPAAGLPPAFTFDCELPLTARPELGDGTWSLGGGASPADCMMCAVDPKAGLAAHLGLAPVLVVSGISRGPALSSDVDQSPAAAVARRASLVGVPSLAACLASTSAQAPVEGVVEATARLVCAAAEALERGGGWPSPTNLPRAHFPFPTRGRWALGRELPLPGQHGPSSSSSSRHGGRLQGEDSWALGSDNSWAASGGSTSGSARATYSEGEALELLRQAFCEADLFLLLNAAPRWDAAAGRPFAATRPGVLWHCHQVEAAAAGSASTSGGGSSWQATEQDLYGRSLPSQGLDGSGGYRAGAFVAQDNTASVVERARGGAGTSSSSSSSSSRAWAQGAGTGSSAPVPRSFVVRRGTLLSDEATGGDVEALFGGRATVSTLQAWPCGHPFAVRDEVLVQALCEGRDGLPQWLLV